MLSWETWIQYMKIIFWNGKKVFLNQLLLDKFHFPVKISRFSIPISAAETNLRFCHIWFVTRQSKFKLRINVEGPKAFNIHFSTSEDSRWIQNPVYHFKINKFWLTYFSGSCFLTSVEQEKIAIQPQQHHH